jgi:methionyl-tRNA synthetase
MPAPGAFTDADTALLSAAKELVAKSRAAIQDFALHLILSEIWRVVAEANRYFASEEPWIKRKTDPARMETILYVTGEVLRMVAIMTQPFMPASMGKLLDSLGVPETGRTFADAGRAIGLAYGTPMPPPSPIFPRYVEPSEPGSIASGPIHAD